ncbi:uncharacterized protein ASCRUDRAFT_5911 [Ascoidea rubescens DSM 1968]|uniref:Uncharacterized protein n=1 Tax=Ascoidea rubescens DSM 1968 TaxID=1344418 RepID=A0A1D2VQZ0_9ASCO|nr:hypothetical protein ASCRUDRAFT_5911 [Ascoidea rubescens DSM 1968]ODV64022.1 hypothetical protein ASCRUDRAFT_5911 [Ascoidea rubescens DSM 1968]
MDRRTFHILSQRLDYLELLCNSRQLTSNDTHPSVLVQLSQLHSNLKEIVASNYSRYSDLFQIISHHNLWSEVPSHQIDAIAELPSNYDNPHLNSQNTNDTKDVEIKKKLILSNEDDLKCIIKNINDLSSLNSMKLINKNFADLDLLDQKYNLLLLKKSLNDSFFPNRYHPLFIKSIAIAEGYINLINKQNKFLVHIEESLLNLDLSLRKKEIAIFNKESY